MYQVDEVLALVRAERLRQDRLWGNQAHGDDRWLAILTEEVGEAAKDINDAMSAVVDTEEALTEEIVQVAAVAISWLETRLYGSACAEGLVEGYEARVRRIAAEEHPGIEAGITDYHEGRVSPLSEVDIDRGNGSA